MQVLEISPPRSEQTHLTAFRDLERHCHNESKHEGYERLLKDFGINQNSFAALEAHPRLLMAEQPGSWFCADDLLRYRLFHILREAFPFHKSSGVLSLAKDAFTCRGAKRLFLLFQLHKSLLPVQLIGASYIRRYRNRVYHALSIEGSAHDRLAAILDTSLSMLSSAAISHEAFTKEVMAIFRRGVRSGIRPLLPAKADRRSLTELGARFAECNIEAAKAPLAAARVQLVDGISWVRYWDMVNEMFLGTRIGKLGPLFNRFLLAIDDPIKMSRQLIRLSGHPTGKPIAIAAIFSENEKYRMVYFDPKEKNFFFHPKSEQRESIDWDSIRERARSGNTGGPAGVLEYLFMAASGIYLVVDPEDGFRRFEKKAQEIHRIYTGLSFPYITFPSTRKSSATDYLQIYEPAFGKRTQAMLDRFFE